MRIGVLQFAPTVGEVEHNLNRADAVLNKANPKDLDLIVLPELAFTGKSSVDCRVMCTGMSWSFPEGLATL
jgi:predicted amidohydrolase